LGIIVDNCPQKIEECPLCEGRKKFNLKRDKEKEEVENIAGICPSCRGSGAKNY
jgi:hypothetical protein